MKPIAALPGLSINPQSAISKLQIPCMFPRIFLKI
jgi:hypothetical protein